MFTKILIANRGEIAIRIIRACKEMGISTVAVYSEADRESLHVALADEAICIGGPRADDSYLNGERIVSAALATHAQAIHPGYGFLSENAGFAALCKEHGVVFIGPPAEVISNMGDKDAARRLMKQNNVPTTPGTDILRNAQEAKEAAANIGYPVLIKASAGGGGKGIRLIEREEDMERAFETASSEAQKAFGDGRMYMEKYLDPVKHIEVQLLADEEGNIVCLGERECSIQRNNQKLIEESPSPGVSPEIRREAYGHRRPGRQGLRLCQRRHGGVFDGQGQELLLYGDEHPPAGGAPCFRAGDGHRHCEVADPHRRRRAPGLYPGGHPRAGRGHRVPHQRQGPRQGGLLPHPGRPLGAVRYLPLPGV